MSLNQSCAWIRQGFVLDGLLGIHDRIESLSIAVRGPDLEPIFISIAEG